MKNNYHRSLAAIIIKMFGSKCIICSSENSLSVDHRLALCLGGTNEIANIQILCKRCHKQKTREDLEKFAQNNPAVFLNKIYRNRR